MKKIYSVITALMLLSFIRTDTADLKSAIEINEIRPGVFCVVHAYPWPSNSIVAVTGNGDILIVDTPYTPEAAESMLRWIDSKFGKRNITAINTHFHVDRLGGNEALVKRKIPVYSSELTAKAIKERGENSIRLTASWAKDESIKSYYMNFRYTYPTHIFDSKKGLDLVFGNEKVIVRFYGTGHSIDNLFVFLPDKKTIFGGCAIISMENKTPGNVSDGSVTEWIKTIEKIDYKGYTCVIPGHGRPGGVELIEHTKDVLRTSLRTGR